MLEDATAQGYSACLDDNGTPVEGWYVQDVYGDIYAVKGLVHPPGRVAAIPKYLRDRTQYRKLPMLQQAFRFLEESRPGYLYEDRYAGTRIPAIPLQMVRSRIRPSLHLPANSPRKLAEAAESLAERLAAVLQRGSIGFTGSLLLGLATEHSDIDIVVYGLAEGELVWRTLSALRRAGGTRPVTSGGLGKLLASRADSRIDLETWSRHEGRKVLTGLMNGYLYTLKLVPHLSEYWESYGDRICRNLGQAEVVCRVSDDRLGIYTPNVYGVRVREVVEGPESARDVSQIVSMRSRFAESCLRGEEIVVRGRLEEVILRGHAFHRIFLGSSVEDVVRLAG